MFKNLSRIWISLAIGLLVCLVLLFLRSFDFLDSLELRTLDYRFGLRGPYTGLLSDTDLTDDSLDVVLVDLDDESHRLLPYRWPYPRDVWGEVVRNLTRAGAAVIAFDIEFDSRGATTAEGDSAFAAAIRKAHSEGTDVVLAAKLVEEPHLVPPRYVQEPIPVLMEAGPDLGLVNEIKDLDGFTRRYMIFNYLEREGKVYLSLGLKAVANYLNLPDSVKITQSEEAVEYGPLTIQSYNHPGQMLINYYGPPSHGGPRGKDGGPWMTFHRYPLSSVLDDADYELKVPREDTNWMEMFYPDGKLAEFGLSKESPFQNKIVVIGASLDELHDVKETPYYTYEGYQHLMPGMETHANAIQQMLHNNYIHDISEPFVVLILLILVVITAVVVTVASPLLGAGLSLLLGWAYLDIAFGLFFRDYFWTLNRLFHETIGRIGEIGRWAATHGIPYNITPPALGRSVYIPVIVPLLGILLTYVGNVVYQFIAEQQEKRWIRNAFGHFLSPKVVNELMDNPGKLSLGGERRYLTVFFSDIQGFTTIAEKMEPEELSEFLNQYLSELTGIILSYEGIIDKYEGDAIMAEFGAPLPAENHASQACHAALDAQIRLRDLREEWAGKGLPEIWTRIGINSGVVALGNFGSQDVFDYTVMGDAVNIGARLEAANKQYGTSIMISESTRREVQDEFTTRFLDLLVVKGKTEPVRVYELIGRKGDESPPLISDGRILEPYARGVDHYFNREWDAGIEAFREVLDIHEEDGPATLFLARCREYAENPPPDDWDGVFRMTDK